MEEEEDKGEIKGSGQRYNKKTHTKRNGIL